MEFTKGGWESKKLTCWVLPVGESAEHMLSFHDQAQAEQRPQHYAHIYSYLLTENRE